jgi:plasmid stabilization system protein ParE
LRVTLRATAEADLDGIYEFIAQDNPEAALRFTARIRDQCNALAEFPERGTLREDLGAGVRTFGFERRVTIAFRVLSDRVQILRIFYRGRDVEHLLRQDRLE